MRERGDARLGRRLSRTKKQPMRERQRRAQQPVPPSSSEEARQQAQAEGLTLRVADNKAGYYGVHLNKPRRSKHLNKPGRSKPYATVAVARWQEGEPGLLRQRRGGGTVRRAVAGGAGSGGGAGCTGPAWHAGTSGGTEPSSSSFCAARPERRSRWLVCCAVVKRKA